MRMRNIIQSTEGNATKYITAAELARRITLCTVEQVPWEHIQELFLFTTGKNGEKVQILSRLTPGIYMDESIISNTSFWLISKE